MGVSLEEAKHYVDDNLNTFYIAHEGSGDGSWCDWRKQADYHSGSSAIQFAQLLLVKLAPDYNLQRSNIEEEQAREFAETYRRYFGPGGAAILFGTSWGYCFAVSIVDSSGTCRC